jgi:hypothetical protein
MGVSQGFFDNYYQRMLEEFTTDNKIFSHIITKFFVIKQLAMIIGLSMVVPLPKNIQWCAYLFMLVFVLVSVFIQYRYIKYDSPKNLIFNNKMKEA